MVEEQLGKGHKNHRNMQNLWSGRLPLRTFRNYNCTEMMNIGFQSDFFKVKYKVWVDGILQNNPIITSMNFVKRLNPEVQTFWIVCFFSLSSTCLAILWKRLWRLKKLLLKQFGFLSKSLRGNKSFGDSASFFQSRHSSHNVTFCLHSSMKKTFQDEYNLCMIYIAYIQMSNP